MRTLSSHKPVLYTIPPLAPAPAPQDPRCRVPAASSQVSRPRPSAARCIVYNRDLVAREAASLSHYLLDPTLALGGAHEGRVASSAPTRRHPSRHLQPLRRAVGQN